MGYLDFKYTSLPPGVVPATPAATGSISLDSDLPFSPSFTFNGSANGTPARSAVSGYFWVRTDDRYSDEDFIDPDNSFATAQPSYSLIHVRLPVSRRARWNATGDLPAGNQPDRRTDRRDGVTSGPKLSQITYKPPRQWVVGVHFRF